MKYKKNTIHPVTGEEIEATFQVKAIVNYPISKKVTYISDVFDVSNNKITEHTEEWNNWIEKKTIIKNKLIEKGKNGQPDKFTEYPEDEQVNHNEYDEFLTKSDKQFLEEKLNVIVTD